MKLIILILISFSSLLLPIIAFSESVSSSTETIDLTNKHTLIQKKAIKYMKENQIRQNEEFMVEDIIDNKWTLIGAVNYKGKTLLKMSLCDQLSNVEDINANCRGLEVLGMQKNGTIVKFEDFFSIPKSLIVKFQYPTGYFAKLEDKESIASAMKAVYSGNRKMRNGLNAKIIKDKKHDFDPTPGRNWRIVKATFNLYEDESHETLDIQAADLDLDFDTFYSSGGIREKIKLDNQEIIEALVVNPWGVELVIPGEEGFDEAAAFCSKMNIEKYNLSVLNTQEKKTCEEKQLNSIWTFSVFLSTDIEKRGACSKAWCLVQ